MTAQHLTHPEWWVPLAVLFALAVAALLLARARGRRQRSRLGPSLRPGLSLARDGALLLALAAIGLALLGPRIGEKTVLTPASGVDLVLLLDASRSMDAADVPPSRLARARRTAKDLLARLRPGDRAALATFASRGVLLTPLTPDHAALAELLGAVDTNLIRPTGSSLGAGVRAALAAFEAGSERPRVLFVLSDGEDPQRSTDLGAPDALRAELRVLAAAFGSEAGATVPDHGVPLRDGAGGAVISRRRSDRLARLAAATGGAVFPADAWGAVDLDAASAAVRRDAGELPGQPVERRVRAVRVLPFAALALLLLAVEGLPRPRRGQSSAALATVGAALLLGAGPAQAPSSAVGERLVATPGDPALLVELGLERLARGRHDTARRAFLAAALTARDPELASLAYYDLGVAALEEADYAVARDAFFDALALRPGDRKARYNLEWTLKALPDDAPPPPPPAEPEPGDTGPERERPELAADAEQEQRQPEREQASGLSEAERQRWLGRVHDDLGRALRSAAEAEERERPRRGPAW